MPVPSLTRTLILESTSVVSCKVPASGALVAGVKEGPDKMVTAWDHAGIATIAAVSQDKIARYVISLIIIFNLFINIYFKN